jgi:UDP-4-amino-4,6-dideoxy-N-acetyl-beta-L-altrosamine transaminase
VNMLIQRLKYMKPIPYGKQNITDEDVKAVVEVLRSDFLTQGPKVKEFEEAFAAYIGCKFAVAVANGTGALHLAALALGVKPGDKVITPPITFAASSNCIRYCGGDVVFSDIENESFLIDITRVRELLRKSPKGTYKGIVAVDFAGLPVDLQKLREVADEFGLWILEDACHAPGGFFTDRSGIKQYCGNGVYADAAIFSFHPVKHIATGEGGMITTNNQKLYDKLMLLRTHGITRDSQRFQNSIEFARGGTSAETYPAWYMEMQELGFNYRLTDFQCALGISQLARADDGLKRRKQIAMRYDEAFKNIPAIRTQKNSGPEKVLNAYHLYLILVDRRVELYEHLRAHNIFAQVHYIPTHLMPYYRQSGWKEVDLPVAEEFYKKCLSLPMYPTLTDEEQEYVIDKISRFLKSY